MAKQELNDPNPQVPLDEILETVNKLINQLRELTNGRQDGPENNMLQHALSVRTTLQKQMKDENDPSDRPDVEFIRGDKNLMTGKLPNGRLCFVRNDRSCIRLNEYVFVTQPNKDKKRFIKIRNTNGRIYNPEVQLLG